jgi:uncharacterized protein (DUF1501 family)
MRRREFLRVSAAAAAAPLAGRLWAAPGRDARFLLIFLRGGYDATSLLVPVSSTFYYEARPKIALAKSDCLEIDADWGLHPALRETVWPFWQKRELAFVPFAGTGDLSRSHFSTQDGIELGQAPWQRRDYSSGFLNRLASRVGGSRAISFTSEVPIALRGRAGVANAALRFAAQPGLDERESRLVAGMYRNTPLAAPVAEGFAAKADVRRSLTAEMIAADRDLALPRSFALDARRVGRLMKSSFNLGFIDVGGWDTHVNQGGSGLTPGFHLLALHFERLGRGIAALADELGPAWRDTVVVVISEFGRTFRENGSQGTDHGHGTAYWVLGGAVRGGRFAGEQVRVERATLHQDRDYPVLNEYRAVLGGIFARLYGLGAADLEGVFAGATPADLGLL